MFRIFCSIYLHTTTLNNMRVSFKVYFYSSYGNDVLWEDDEWWRKNKVRRILHRFLAALALSERLTFFFAFPRILRTYTNKIDLDTFLILSCLVCHVKGRVKKHKTRKKNKYHVLGMWHTQQDNQIMGDDDAKQFYYFIILPSSRSLFLNARFTQGSKDNLTG